MSKTASIRLPDNIQTDLRKNFGGLQSAISLIVEPFDRVRILTVDELKGYFTHEELVALTDSQNGVLLSPDFIYNKSFLLAQLEDFEGLEGGISRQGADPNALLEKIKNLSQSQVFFLLLHTHIFWNNPNDLNKHLEKLV